MERTTGSATEQRLRRLLQVGRSLVVELDPETVLERILEVEHRIYPDALRLLATGGVQLEGDICKTPDSTGSGNFLISPVASGSGNSV